MSMWMLAAVAAEPQTTDGLTIAVEIGLGIQGKARPQIRLLFNKLTSDLLVVHALVHRGRVLLLGLRQEARDR